MFDPRVTEAVRRLTEALAGEHPEIAEIVEKLQLGITSEVEAMKQLMALVQEHPHLAKRVEALAEEAFAPLRAPTPEDPLITDLGVATGHWADVYAENVPLTYTKDKITALNPLMDAAIHERVQFDGDAPELRSGPLPEGGTPAVPVVTTARNPVFLGKQLEEASLDVTKAIEQVQLAAIQEHEDQVAMALLDDPDRPADMVRAEPMLPTRPTGVPGYEAGQLPVPRQVTGPTGSALARMSPEERQQAAYKALSTTQGRRSALSVIEDQVLWGLSAGGHPMEARPPSRVTDVPVYAEWTVKLSGAVASQSQFSFLDVAAKALIQKLLPQLAEATIADPVLEIIAVNTVDVRQVGWAARVVAREG